MDSRSSGDQLPSNFTPPSFGYLLRRLRKASDLTQRELGRRVGCAADTIHKIETDARRPSRAVAERLADALGLVGDERMAFMDGARSRRAPARLGITLGPRLIPTETSPLPIHVPPLPGPLIGREHELALLNQLLAEPTTRLITLCGIGGIGKTWLALAAATDQLAALSDVSAQLSRTVGSRESFVGPQKAQASPSLPVEVTRFIHGICCVDLSGLHSSSQLIAAIATALKLPIEYGPCSPRRQLSDYLRQRHMLLILDNYEQPAEEGIPIDTLLADAPSLVLLVTSRERLQLQHEQLLFLEGLPTTAEPGSHAPATQLFLQAAHRAWPDFSPAEGDLVTIRAICHLLEGIPLAIELAAAWVTILSPEAILAELQQSNDLLWSNLRDLPERQRSFSGIFTTVWHHLDPPARATLARLSVFRGSFTLTAARSVADVEITTLSNLFGHALLRHHHDRFALYELLRRYAAQHLDADPDDASELRQRHASYYLQLLIVATTDRATAAQLLSIEAENLAAAWRYALSYGLIQLLDHAVDALGRLYTWQNARQQGCAAFDQALAVVQTVEPLRTRLLAWRTAFQQHEGAGEIPLATDE
jgi:predicted ATPase/transcriptional regulator with XRE-family HTH domain